MTEIELYRDPTSLRDAIDPAATVIAGTGHRLDKLSGYGKAIYREREALAQLRENLRLTAKAALQKLSPDMVITGMALGWDTALAEASRELRIPFVAAVPFRGQEGRWNPADQNHYRELLADAAIIAIVRDGGFTREAMLERNAVMVDHANRVLALWNGDMSGGTSHAIRYARQHSVPISNVWRTYRKRYWLDPD